jgi:hypothetical protein
MRHRLHLLRFVPLLTLAALACESEPLPGELLAVIETPNDFEGAALVQLEGVYPSVSASVGDQVFAHVADGVTRVVVVRRGASWDGPLQFRVPTSDVRRPPDAVVLQVADLDNALRVITDEYRVAFRRVDQ